MEGENNTNTVEMDIQDGEGEWLLEGKSEPESWIYQVKHKYRSRGHKMRETSLDVSIYRVPECIKKTKREAYDPVVVCLGPYHHKKHQQLTAMDEYKLQALDRTLERLHGMTIKELLEMIGELKKEIRDCYEDSAIEWDDDTLVWMMTMDACFILEFLRMDLPKSSLIFHRERGYNIKRREIMSDILKLENQIPLCVLKKILQLEKEGDSLAELLLGCNSREYFRGYPFSLQENEKVGAILTAGNARHLLDLSRQVIDDFLANSGSGGESAIPDKCCGRTFHCSTSSCIVIPNGGACKWCARSLRCGTSSCIVIPNGGACKNASCFKGASCTAVSRWLHRSNPVDESLIPSAEKLQRAGIKLKLSPEGRFYFKRRCFRSSTLFLPQITVDDDTEIFLRNLVAFEECQRGEKHDNSQIKRVISLYMCIMDNLIDSKEDVGLFRRANIIKNYLGTDAEVARIFNDLCIGITYKNDFEEDLRNVNEHYNSQLNRWISEFRKERCSKPWYIVSIVAAVLLLVMTLLQTIYTMKGYFRS